MSERDGNKEIYVMNADGTGQTRLTNKPAPDDCPAWSPDGSKIAFGWSYEGSGEVYVMNADGTGQARLAEVGLAEPPTWSPDGSQIAFVSQRGFDTGLLYEPNAREIYVMNADGTGQTRLTNNEAKDESPRWSP
jgi:TolB protein